MKLLSSIVAMFMSVISLTACGTSQQSTAPNNVGAAVKVHKITVQTEILAESISNQASYTDQLLKKATNTYHSSQAIIVTAASATSYQATLTTYSYQNKQWKKIYSMPAALGKFGITTNMHEGMAKSPAGIYSLGKAFGEVNKPSGVKMPYTKTASKDYWVEDPNSSLYNKWVTYSGNPYNRWNSFERLRIPAYKYAVVINYNTNPIIKGKGSAIFLHVLLPQYKYTLGCTAVSEHNMLTLLKWLNSNDRPLIIQGTQAQLKALSH